VDEVPARAKSAGGPVGYKEETVDGESDRSKQGSAGSEGSWKRRVVRGTNRDSSGSGDRRSGQREG